MQHELSVITRLPKERIRLVYLDGSGCYGRNGHEDASADAALIAMAIGRPVRVQWMRHDETALAPKSPPTSMDLEAALDANGNITGWKGDFYIAVIEKAGRPAIEVIAEIVPDVAKSFPWPKSMRWGAASAQPGALNWVRPLHSIVATFGPETEDPEVVPFTLPGIASEWSVELNTAHPRGEGGDKRLPAGKPFLVESRSLVVLKARHA